MPRQCLLARERRRVKMSANNWKRRQAIKTVIKSVNSTPEERWTAVIQLQKRRRDESPCRIRSCCTRCHRHRSIYRRFALCRICLRELCMSGHVPGLVKSSW